MADKDYPRIGKVEVAFTFNCPNTSCANPNAVSIGATMYESSRSLSADNIYVINCSACDQPVSKFWTSRNIKNKLFKEYFREYSNKETMRAK